MNRIAKDEYYLGIAEAVSRRSTCMRRQYGAVIVKNDEIISTGYNGAPRGEENCCDTGLCTRINAEHNDGNYGDCPAVHAEMNAIISASRKDMIGATMYLFCREDDKVLNAEPCPFCGDKAERTEKAEEGLYVIRCHNPNCIGRDIFPVFYVKKDAIKAWNGRVKE